MKKLIASITVSMLTLAFFSNAHADDSSHPPEPTITDHSLEFAGTTYTLFSTYTDTESARSHFTSKYPEFFASAEHNYGLPPLSEENATDYKELAISLSENSDSVETYRDVVSFLDYYENSQQNKEITDAATAFAHKIEAGQLSEKEAAAQLALLLPLTKENNNMRLPYGTRNSGINLQAAQLYAAKHAPDGYHNPTFGYEMSRKGYGVDCTNFVSQILHAGGVPMDYGADEFGGWWWKSRTNRSISWVRARTFAAYMGSGYTAQVWVDIFNNVRPGDIIGLDETSDGDVDHLGFIHSKNASKLLIAQHSPDYFSWRHKWSRHERVGTYHRIRR
ncbi:amidase domain-containing protein [Schaalia turicensis]|uniref:amidase domain-containing protein n=1 Tax=Schaalia turicensis TaxID=131111 RepID=UPI00368FB069